MTHAPQPVPDDPAITAVLERLDVPDHRPGFWDDLTRAVADPMERADPPASAADGGEPVALPAGPARPSVRRLLLMAAAVALVAASALAIVHRSDEQRRVQTVDTGPAASSTATTTAASQGSSTPTIRAEALDNASVVGGSARGWLFSDLIVWTGDGFAATSEGDPSTHWSSADGIRWTHHDEPNPAVPARDICPGGYDCEVTPTSPEIPFHFALPFHQIVAKAGDRLIIQAGVTYRLDAQGSADPAEPDAAGSPTLHPDLLAAAAETAPCFRDLQRQTGAGEGDRSSGEGARLASWGIGGLSDPVIRLTCAHGSDVAGFTLDLRDHLSDGQLQAVFGSELRELWVATPGSPAVRVDDPPTTTYRFDDLAGGGPNALPSAVLSTGDRFWALDEGSLVSSSDGRIWTPLPVATDGLEITDVAAATGGHLALRLVADRLAGSPVGRVIVSHDDGASWSQPVEVTGAARLWVGPAGAAVLDDTETGATLALVDDGSARTVITAGTNAIGRLAVGDDRLLVQSWRPEDPKLFTVYDLEGNPLHQAVYDPSAGRGRALLRAAAITAAAMAATLGATMWLRRRRSPAARAGAGPGAVQ